MAGPQFNSVGTRSTSSGATSLSPAKPTAAGASGVMLAVVTSKNNAVHSTATSGWSLVAQVNSGASFTASLWKAKGNAAAPTFTWTGSAAASAQISYHDDPAGILDTVLGATGSNSGATSTHSSSSITTTRANSLAIYVDVAAANTALATPSGWTENVDAGSATDAGRTVWGSKTVASSGGSSGAISVTGANAAWVQFQVELRVEEAAANALQVSKASLGAWLDPPAGAGFSKVELGAWLDSPDEFAVSKVELGAWLDLPSGGTPRRQPMVGTF
jgi:hypothetical protein